MKTVPLAFASALAGACIALSTPAGAAAVSPPPVTVSLGATATPATTLAAPLVSSSVASASATLVTASATLEESAETERSPLPGYLFMGLALVGLLLYGWGWAKHFTK